MKTLLTVLLALPFAVSCAAHVVVDAAAEGGSGGAAPDGGSAPACDALLAQLAEAIVAASACGVGPDVPFMCARVPGVLDACGCQVAVDAENPAGISAAAAAYTAVAAAGCAPACDMHCPSEWASPACSPDSTSGGAWHCVLIAGD